MRRHSWKVLRGGWHLTTHDRCHRAKNRYEVYHTSLMRNREFLTVFILGNRNASDTTCPTQHSIVAVQMSINLESMAITDCIPETRHEQCAVRLIYMLASTVPPVRRCGVLKMGPPNTNESIYRFAVHSFFILHETPLRPQAKNKSKFVHLIKLFPTALSY